MDPRNRLPLKETAKAAIQGNSVLLMASIKRLATAPQVSSARKMHPLVNLQTVFQVMSVGLAIFVLKALLALYHVPQEHT